jgi:hypothetical protein
VDCTGAKSHARGVLIEAPIKRCAGEVFSKGYALARIGFAASCVFMSTPGHRSQLLIDLSRQLQGQFEVLVHAAEKIGDRDRRPKKLIKFRERNPNFLFLAPVKTKTSPKTKSKLKT